VLIAVDATGVAENGAGVVTYLLGLINGWKDAGFEDEWALQGTGKLPDAIADAVGAIGTAHRVGTYAPWWRVAVQQAVLPVRNLWSRPDVLLCTTPVVPALTLGLPVVAVVHDLRHLSRPGEFGKLMRLYRGQTWGSGIRRADRLIADSERTLNDLQRAYPKASGKAEVVHLGSDHVDRVKRAEPAGHGIAFARWANKRPGFAIRAWGALKQRQPDLDRPLHVIGAPADQRPELEALARELGVGDLVVVHPFLEDDRFWELFSSAGVVLFPSTFEGFGLPVLEAMRLGVPVVTWRDPAVAEVAGDCVAYADPDPEAFAAELEKLFSTNGEAARLVEAARERAASWTWRATAEKTRAVLQKAVDEAGAR
jgi:glycosyltransferase involved in cell wall biosynthesis